MRAFLDSLSDGDQSGGVENLEDTVTCVCVAYPAVVAEPSDAERQKMVSHIHHLHRAAGHCSSCTLAKLIADAGHPKWVVDIARELQCDACNANKPAA